MSKRVFEEIADLITEGVNPRSYDLDAFSTSQILELMSQEDQKVASAVHEVLADIEKAVESVLSSFRQGGRLIYVGAGTSGRLGILDASECPPTFGTDPRQVIGLIAGGKQAVFESQEGAEDNLQAGKTDLKNVDVSEIDTVIGIASSSRTPYVLGALQYANEIGASAGLIACNPRSVDDMPVDFLISPTVGPEVVMGSTRLKAGSATKMILNMITTTAFIRSGKIFKGMMVDLKAWSEKLKARSRRVLMLATGLDYDQAGTMLEDAGGSVKTAIVMTLCNVGKTQAEFLLEEADGFVRNIQSDQIDTK